MKKLSIIFLALLMPLMAAAQQVRFAYFSYQNVLHAMSGYAIAQRNMDELRAKYDAEAKRSEAEFNNKYEEFLDGQRDFAPSILKKRQAELQELAERGIAFRDESEQLLKKAEEDALAPLRQRIDAAVRQLGHEKGYAFILNTDNNALPYVDETLSDNVTETLKQMLH